MPHRVFRDREGRAWEVWSVVPARVERRVADVPLPADQPERRRRDEPRAFIGPRWRFGWLAFHSATEKRRLAPFPSDWFERSDTELAKLCEEAAPIAPQRRRIE